MKKTLIALFALAFAFTFGAANAAKHEMPKKGDAPKAEMKKDAKKDVKKKGGAGLKHVQNHSG